MSLTLPKYEGELTLVVLVLYFMHMKDRCGYQNYIKLGHAMKPLFNILQFNVFHHLNLNVNKTKSSLSVKLSHSRNSSVKCSNQLLPQKTLHRGFTVFAVVL
jgi:hypothetical protein